MKNIHLSAVFAIGLLVLTGANAQWPTTNGNSQHNGLSDYLGPVEQNVRWEDGAAAAWFGGPIFVEGNRMVTMRFNGLGNSPLICYDITSGAELWRVDFPGNAARGLPIGFRDGQVYAINFSESQHDTLYALNPEDGSIIWTSPQRVFTGIIFSAVFAENGDLIVPADDWRLARIDHLTGDTLWTTYRLLPVVGGSEHLAVFGSKVYGWQGSIVTPKELTAWDIDTGAELYSLALPGDGDQEIPISCGPDGTIYAQRDGGLFYAVRDNGSALEILWSHAVTGTPVWGHFGVGADGGVLAADGTDLVKLDPVTGQELARSVPMITGQWFAPRFAIGADSIIYMGNGAFEDGAFYAMTPDLDTLWSLAVPSITYSGPAFGPQGEIIISGNGSRMVVYEGRGSANGASERPNSVAQSVTITSVYPNPFNAEAEIEFAVPREGTIQLVLYDVLGRQTASLSPLAHAGMNRIHLSAPGLPTGSYVLRAQSPAGTASARVMLVR